MLKKRTTIAEMRLQDFVLPHLSVTEDEALTQWQRFSISNANGVLSRLAERHAADQSSFVDMPYPERPSEKWVASTSMSSPCFGAPCALEDIRDLAPYVSIVVLSLDGDPRAICHNGLPFVLPAYRGQGIGASFHLFADQFRMRLFDPCSFSTSGKAARLAAHRMAVQSAYQSGKAVHPDNISLYGLGGICESTSMRKTA